MVLVDTCGWIETITEGPMATVFAPYLTDLQAVLVPTIIQCELYRWARRERGEQSAAELVSFLNAGHVVALNTELAMMAGDLSSRYGLALADSIILATATKHKAKLVTCDAHFQKAPSVEYHSKKA